MREKGRPWQGGRDELRVGGHERRGRVQGRFRGRGGREREGKHERHILYWEQLIYFISFGTLHQEILMIQPQFAIMYVLDKLWLMQPIVRSQRRIGNQTIFMTLFLLKKNTARYIYNDAQQLLQVVLLLS